MSRLSDEINLYGQHIVALVWPGRRVAGLDIDEPEPGDVSKWAIDDLRFLVEEGRRQLDRQRADLDRLQNRSQFLFTTALALIALLASETSVIQHRGWSIFVPWYVGLVTVVLGALGAAALMAVRSDFGIVHATLLSQSTPPISAVLAATHAQIVSVGENTILSRITVYRDATSLVVVGAILQVVVWLAH